MGRTKQYTVCLTDSERKALHAFVSSGRKSARQITRARILLLADAGKTDREIIDLLGVSRPPVSSMRKKYAQGVFDHILDLLPDDPRSGRPIQVDSGAEAHIAMIACYDRLLRSARGRGSLDPPPDRRPTGQTGSGRHHLPRTGASGVKKTASSRG